MNTEDKHSLDDNENLEFQKKKSFFVDHSFSEVDNAFQTKRDEENEPVQNEVERIRYKSVNESDKPPVERRNISEEKAVAEAVFAVKEDDIQEEPYERSGFSKAFLPNSDDSVKEKIRKIIMDLSILVLVGCVIWFGALMFTKHKALGQTKELKKQIISDGEKESGEWAEFLSKYPDVKLPDGMMRKYAYLYATNNEMAGWINIPNSNIDMQIVKAPDNEKYLKTDFYGNYSRYGCPFMDYRNDSRELMQNTIIYGHHMSDGFVFSDLDKYKKVEGFAESPIINFDTIYASYKFKIYSVIITNAREADDNGYIFNYTAPEFATPENFMAYIKALDERSLYKTGVNIQSTDKLLTLSTCTYDFNDARLVVIGRMVRSGESEKVDTSKAVVNQNPRMPQAWYSRKGHQNPFRNAERWYVE